MADAHTLCEPGVSSPTAVARARPLNVIAYLATLFIEMTAAALLPAQHLILNPLLSPLQEPLGQGAFATVKKCRLRQLHAPAADAKPSANRRLSISRVPSFRKPSPATSAKAAKENGAGAAGGQLVAVKQLKPAVLGDETELHGFIAETDGALLL